MLPFYISIFFGLFLDVGVDNFLDDRVSDEYEFHLVLTESRTDTIIENHPIIQKADSLQNAGEFEQVIELLDNFIEKKDNIADSLKAAAHHKMGVAYYYLLEDQSAIDEWRKAIDLRATFLPDNHISIKKGYYNIGSAYIGLEDYQNAKKQLEISLLAHIKNSIKDSLLLFRTFFQLAQTCSKLEDLVIAHDYLLQSENLVDYIEDTAPWELITYYDTKFEFYYKIKDFEKGISIQQEKIALINSFDELFEEDKRDIANSYSNIGLSLDLLLKYEEAQAAYRKAYDLYIENDGADQEIFDNVSNLADSYIESKDYSKSLEQIEKAYNLTSGDIKNQTNLLLKEAKIYAELKEINKSNSKLEKIEEILKEMKPSPSIILLEMQLEKSTILNTLYNVTSDIAYLKNAASTYNEVKILIGELINNHLVDDSKIQLNQKFGKQMESALDVFYKLQEQTHNATYVNQALELSEQYKSIALFDAVSRKSNTSNNVSDEIQQKESHLRSRISKLEKARILSNDTVQSDELTLLKLKLSALSNIIEKENQPSNTAASDNHFALSLDLLESTPFIEYFVGDQYLYRFYNTMGQLTMDRQEKSSLTKSVSDFRTAINKEYDSYINDKDISDSVQNSYTSTSYDLYQALLKDIVVDTKNLLIIPDGVLHYLPFEALITDTNGTQKPKPSYLINKINIAYANSLGLYQHQNTRENHPTKKLLAIAPSFKDKIKFETANRSIANIALGPLFFNEEEVDGIVALFEGDVLKGANASELNFVDKAEDYRILHLATHGVSNNILGDYAYLAFTPSDDSVENEFLYNSELYNLNLNADMVVLSACETGIGELRKGEGVISLARGFSYAGAKSVITTLWSINDLKTKDIMSGFYSYLQQGYSKDDALRQAKLDFIESDPHPMPFYWAAFIPMGNMDAIEHSNNFSWLPILSILAIILLFFIIWMVTKNKR